MADPYQTLGLTKTATDADIRKAYRKLAKEHHPDLNPGNKDAEARFKDISAAYALLSDPEKRRASLRPSAGSIATMPGPVAISATGSRRISAALRTWAISSQI